MAETAATYPSLAGKSVVVTGGASGIGAEIVRRFVAQDARVGFLDRDAGAAAALRAELGGAPVFAQCDLRDIPALQAALAGIAEAIGPAQVLVNNAARDDRHDWREVTEAYWDERMQNNLRHVFFAIQAVAPDMIAGGGGAVVNIGSSCWHEAGGGFPAYATAKAGVEGLTRTLARDLGPYRIRVNTVVPGWVMTERQRDLWVTPEKVAVRRAMQCLPGLIEPDAVARMVLFLASDEARFCTAGAFPVTAGSV